MKVCSSLIPQMGLQILGNEVFYTTLSMQVLVSAWAAHPVGTLDRLIVSMGGVESPKQPPIWWVFSRLERHMAVVSIFNIILYQESS